MDSPAPPGLNRLSDYRAPDWRVPAVSLHFLLDAERTIVRATLLVERNGQHSRPLLLDGDELETLAVRLNGAEQPLPNSARRLSIAIEGDRATIETTVAIHPAANSRLMGLYASGGNLITQCEAEGFRRISWFPDRPDVLSRYHVRLEADRSLYPVLLANGDRAATGDLPDNRHFAEWQDPHPKPCYLFALVAGPLSALTDSFTTRSGRVVDLAIWVAPADVPRCHHAMHSLKQAMRFDEERYGREYDLDLFNIVAVHDFNFGAMENKGLNIFNARYILADAETATDFDFDSIAAVVAHEYFHNWSGNRVTCRDWFQLSLKEGFTVFRDEEFSADMGSRTVKRVEDVNVLRTAQFAEDAGPMAHPVRPDSFVEISNFYTATIYQKGAEVVRMIHTLLGSERFRQGSDLYFERHDGQAVTCEDFVLAMEDASGVDLGQFRRWYSQAGTPRVSAAGEYDDELQRYTLTLRQSTAPTPGQSAKLPLMIPVALGLLGTAGNLPLRLAGETPDGDTADNTHRVLVLSAEEQTFCFERVMEPPVPALLRGFSAPVRLDYDYSSADLCALMSREDDGFLRWDAAQQFALRALDTAQQQLAAGAPVTVDPLYLDACGELLANTALDPAMVAEMLRLPGEGFLAELAAARGGADVDAIHAARNAVRWALAQRHGRAFEACYQRLTSSAPYAPDAGQIGARSLRNTCLDYLALAGEEGLALAAAQFADASNMSDRLAALQALAYYGSAAQRDATLAWFYEDWQHETLVVNQWLQVQATLPGADTLERVQRLLQHPAFDSRNPNKLRALVGAFCSANPVNFHRADGAGYRFLADQIEELDARNPQIAARLLTPLTKWRNYRGREQLMRAQLQRLADRPNVSRDLYEVLAKALAA